MYRNTYMCIYIYIFIYLFIYLPVALLYLLASGRTANLRTKIPDFRGFDSSTIIILRGGTPRTIGSFPESLSQAILAGIILVGRLGV